MIIKVKSKIIVEGLEIISQSSNSISYRISPIDFGRATKAIYVQTGALKFKVILEDSKEILDDESVSRKVKKTQKELIAQVVGNKIKILTEEKDIKKFFKEIGFDDKDDIAYKLCIGVTKYIDEYKRSYIGKHHLLTYVWRKVFSDTIRREDSIEYCTLRNSIQMWWSKTEYTSLYKTLPYNQFLRFILRNTGYDV